MEHNLSSSFPLLFLTETQISQATDATLVSPTFSILCFYPKLAAASVYPATQIALVCTTWSPSNFLLWPLLNCHPISLSYTSPNYINYVKIFEFTTGAYPCPLPFRRDVYLRDFSVYHQLSLSS